MVDIAQPRRWGWPGSPNFAELVYIVETASLAIGVLSARRKPGWETVSRNRQTVLADAKKGLAKAKGIRKLVNAFSAQCTIQGRLSALPKISPLAYEKLSRAVQRTNETKSKIMARVSRRC